eukprot:CAMPEP_0182874528 /NCGR_PEP_ID=MMETSP0034_2-20130328/12993_1 /TAXON_ID=156128 /ORGANISM="Nephroselmis pyriformis, Strain CCMP717" /LENGTH=74 /DNA_ID=CAMNT_0025007241 /DNA_START=1 /DNA_END=222 /DNA_ORIENTATION=+
MTVIRSREIAERREAVLEEKLRRLQGVGGRLNLGDDSPAMQEYKMCQKEVDDLTAVIDAMQEKVESMNAKILLL